MAGWNVAEPTFFISNQTYPWGEFSRYTAIFHLESSTSTIFLKYLSPVIIIALFAFATLWFPVISSDEKIEIIAAMLIGAIFFHVAYLNAHVPDVAYLTLADKVMMLLI